MGFFDRFKRKKEIPKISEKILEEPEFKKEEVGIEPLKAKTDLLLMKIESLEARYESINEKLKNIERMLSELYQMAKS